MQPTDSAEHLVMDEQFRRLTDQLPKLLDDLVRSPARPWSDLGPLPERGIYVFYENGGPIYVGRTNRMRSRLRAHGRQGSTHHSATFAFVLAREAAQSTGVRLSGSRSEMEKDPIFSALFSEAKRRISRMHVRAIRVDDPIMQTLFEVYTAMVLRTPYNDFDNH